MKNKLVQAVLVVAAIALPCSALAAVAARPVLVKPLAFAAGSIGAHQGTPRDSIPGAGVRVRQEGSAKLGPTGGR